MQLETKEKPNTKGDDAEKVAKARRVEYDHFTKPHSASVSISASHSPRPTFFSLPPGPCTYVIPNEFCKHTGLVAFTASTSSRLTQYSKICAEKVVHNNKASKKCLKEQGLLGHKAVKSKRGQKSGSLKWKALWDRITRFGLLTNKGQVIEPEFNCAERFVRLDRLEKGKARQEVSCLSYFH